jgi:predicted Zn-dependent peptidase
VLVAAGLMDFETIVRYAEKYCGHWPAAQSPREAKPVVGKGGRHTMTDAKLNRQYTMGLTNGPSAQDDRRFAARVLADVIGDSEGSRLYWALVDPAIAEEADFGFYPHDGCGSFYFSLTTDPDKSEQALDIAMKELARAREGLSDDEVERARNKIASSLVLGGEQPLGRMRGIGNQWIYTGEYRSLDDDMKTLLAVTPQSLKDLLNEYSFDPMTIVTLGPNV